MIVFKPSQIIQGDWGEIHSAVPSTKGFLPPRVALRARDIAQL